MLWKMSHRADPAARVIADRHYNRQKPGTPQFVPPGRCVVLLSVDETALWVTSWPFAQYVKHAWAGAWINSAFRNEGQTLSSLLIRDAVSVTRHYYGGRPMSGMVTFIDTTKVRKKRDFGRCYRKAGFKEVGMTKGGLVALKLFPQDMPEAKSPWTVPVREQLCLEI